MTTPTSTLQTLTFNSRALIKPMRMIVYLPPGYADSDMRYPALYLLHRWGADERDWIDALGFATATDRLIGAGAIAPFIAVMPQGDKSFFINAADPGGDFSGIASLDPTYYRDALTGYGDYADYVLEDVIPFIEQKFPVRADRAGRAIGGVEMGGAGAALLAFTHPELFSAVGIHSPMLFGGPGEGPPWIFGLNDPDQFARNNPIEKAKSLTSASKLRVYLDCGLSDPHSDRVADLHWRLVESGIEHTYVSRPGGDDPAYWRENLGEYVGFYAGAWI
jgi:enterochelin esterase-like enzyme